MTTRRVAPHGRQDDPARQDAIGIAGEKVEQLELRGGQPDLVPTQPDASAIKIDDERARIEASGVVEARHSTQRPPHARQELVGIERLARIVVGASSFTAPRKLP
jgi:hypothetical protein